MKNTKRFQRILCALLLVTMVLPWTVRANAEGVEESRRALNPVTITTIRQANGFAEEVTQTSFEYSEEFPSSNYVFVFPDSTGQTMLGLGGAMSESAAYNISKLSADQQAMVYEAYYGESGAQYALTRSSIGSADFSTHSYSYDDSSKADPQLTNFSIAKDYDYIIPAIKMIQSYNPNVKFFAAPWAPPAWMKKSGKRQGGLSTGGISLVNNAMDAKYYESYANYLVKYCQEYAKAGIPVYCLSMQNESQNNPKWECCTWTISAAKTLIGDYLGPAMKNAGLGTKLVIWDWDKGNDTMHKDGMIKYATSVLSDAKVRQYVDGVAFHWYAGDLWHEIAGKPMWSEDFYSLDEVRAKIPGIHLYATEACQEKGAWFGSYEPAYRYIHDILNDFEHGAECFIDWNLVLDAKGGPTQGVDNPCHAPIMLDSSNNVVLQPSYYVMKMISRAVQPGTVHIETASDLSIDKTAVIDENGNVSVLLGNTTKNAQTITLNDGNRNVTVEIPAYSLTTVSYGPEQTCDHAETEVRDAAAATCGADGYTGDTYCLICEELVEEGTVIPATGNHVNTTVKNAKEATCAEPGYTGDTYCDDCSQLVQQGTELPVTNAHLNTIIKDAAEATCGKPGYTGDTFCNDCLQVIAEGTVINPTGNHTWDNGIVTKEPTQTETGLKTFTCTVCEAVKTEDLPILPPPSYEYTALEAMTNAQAAALLTGGEYYVFDGEQYVPVTVSVGQESTVSFVGEDGKTYDESEISTQWTAKNGKTFTAKSPYVTDSLVTYTRTHKAVFLGNRYWYVNDTNPKDTTSQGSTAKAARNNFKNADEFRDDGSTGRNATKDDPFYVAAVYNAVTKKTVTVNSYTYTGEHTSVGADSLCPVTIYVRNEVMPAAMTFALAEEETPVLPDENLELVINGTFTVEQYAQIADAVIGEIEEAEGFAFCQAVMPDSMTMDIYILTDPARLDAMVETIFTSQTGNPVLVMAEGIAREEFVKAIHTDDRFTVHAAFDWNDAEAAKLFLLNSCESEVLVNIQSVDAEKGIVVFGYYLPEV